MHRFLTFVTTLCFGSAAFAEPGLLSLPGGAVVAIEGPGIAVQIVHITDQRCPSNVACVWEGTKRVVLAINPGSAAEERLILCNACDDGAPVGTAAGLRFTFDELEPPVAVIEGLGRPDRIADYTVRILFEPAN